MTLTPARAGDELVSVVCRCGSRLVKASALEERCAKCRWSLSPMATLTLGPDGAVPDPSTWGTT